MKTPLYRFLYSDRILTKVLDKRRVGWLDGGCLILAQALTIWLDAELVLIRSDGHTGFDHACAAVRSPASRNELLYIDADGISSERALLDRWTRLEGLSNPRIYRASKLCFQDRDLSLWLVAQLRARFGQPGTAISSLLGSAHERGGRMPHPRLLSVHSVTDILNLIEDFLVNHFGIDDQQEMHGPAFEMLKHVSVLVELRGNNSLAKLRSGDGVSEAAVIRQYYAPRFRTSQPTTTGNANMRIGTIPVGTILYIQDSVSPLHASTRAAGCREPWIVEAWLPRDYATWDPFLRRFKTVQMAGGHLAVARSLRDRNRLRTVADWILVASMDAGLEKLA